jgi:hypothetical protein
MGFLGGIGDAIGGAMDLAFGEEPSYRTDTRETLAKWQKAYLPQLEDLLTRPTYTPYQGDRVADLSGLEGLSLSALEQGAMDRVTGGTDLQRLGTETLMNLLQEGPQDIDRSFKEGVSDPLMAQFQREVLPNIDRKYAGNNRFHGNERQESYDRNIDDLERNLAMARAGMFDKAYSEQKARQQSISQAIPGMETEQMRQLIGYLGAGEIPRQVEQAKLDADFQEFMRSIGGDEKRVQELLQALGLNATQTDTAVLGGTQGLVQGLLGTEAGASGVIGALGKLLGGS